jgi:TetR/AcrR family transcriptional regulator
MPNQTFFNLPEEKREQILQVAIDEFADNDYDSVSISRMVARAGIAKGSFYQYFTGKEDLHAYLLGLLLEAKSQFMSMEYPDPQHVGIFAYLRWTVEVGVAFQLAYPRLSQVAVRSLNTGVMPRAFDSQMREASLSFYRKLVEVGQEQGDIAPEVDPELAAVVFDSVLTGITGMLVARLAREAMPAGLETQTSVMTPEVTTLMTRTINILEHGLGRCSYRQGGTKDGQVH